MMIRQGALGAPQPAAQQRPQQAAPRPQAAAAVDGHLQARVAKLEALARSQAQQAQAQAQQAKAQDARLQKQEQALRLLVAKLAGRAAAPGRSAPQQTTPSGAVVPDEVVRYEEQFDQDHGSGDQFEDEVAEMMAEESEDGMFLP